MCAQELAVTNARGVRDVGFEVDEGGEYLTKASCAKHRAVKAGGVEKEWEIGVVVGGYVRYDRRGGSTALEGSGVVGVEKGELFSKIEGRGSFTTCRLGRGHDTP